MSDRLICSFVNLNFRWQNCVICIDLIFLEKHLELIVLSAKKDAFV